MFNRITYVLIVCFTLAGTFVFAQIAGKPEESKMNVESASQKYRRIGNNWKAKRALCIELIDTGIVSRGARLTHILKVFGNDAKVFTGSPSSKCFATVFFEEQQKADPAENEAFARAYHGWYLHISSDTNGKVEDYSLSNLHK